MVLWYVLEVCFFAAVIKDCGLNQHSEDRAYMAYSSQSIIEESQDKNSRQEPGGRT